MSTSSRRPVVSQVLLPFVTVSMLTGCGGASSGGNTSKPNPIVTSVGVTANPTSILTTGTSQCIGVVSGTNVSQSVTWIISGPGSISSGGVVTPTGAGTITCTAASTQDVTKTGSATITATLPAVTATITANPTAIVSGQSSTLTYTTANATSATLNGSTIAIGTNQTLIVSPTATTTYTLIATNSSGSKSAAVSVTVTNPPPIVTSVQPTSISVGAADTQLSVSGSGFVPSSIVSVNGVRVSSTFGSSAGINAIVPSNLLAAPGYLSVSVSNPPPGGGTSGNLGWASIGGMSAFRANHAQVLLPNGKVLIAGGGFVSGIVSMSTATADLFDPTTHTFSPTGSMAAARISPTGTLLKNGLVLITGGSATAPNGSVALGAVASAELYDPATGKFAATGNMTTSRVYHTATLLADGTVLIAGGEDNNGNALSSAEVYNPSSGSFSVTGSMATARYLASAAPLQSGLVLVAGGSNGTGDVSNAELYNSVTKTFVTTGSLLLPREAAAIQTLNDGTVLVAGGYQKQNSGALAEAEVYNPSTAVFNSVGSMGTPRYLAASTMLQNGQVIFLGGDDGSTVQQSCEQYDPAAGKFSPTWQMSVGRAEAVATTLNDGSVLIVGGVDTSLHLLSSAEIAPSSDPTVASNTVTVFNPVPTITSLAANSVGAGQQLAINGANFNSSSEVLLNGVSVAAFGNPGATTQVTFYPATVGTYAVQINNPGPGGGQSNIASLVVHVAVDLYPLRAFWSASSVNPFTATAVGTSNTSVQWSVQEGASGGSITNYGFYTAPSTAGTYHVIATASADPTQSSSATVQIGAGAGVMTALSDMNFSHGNGSLALLPNGRVLIAGGVDLSGTDVATNTAELYDPNSKTFSPTGFMNSPRRRFVTATLKNGKVLIAGGVDDKNSTLASAELYDPSTGTFSLTGSMTVPMDFNFPKALTLNDGRVLIACGGGLSTQIYDPTVGQFTTASPMLTQRYGCATALLPDGRVIILGGSDTLGNFLASAEIFDPTTNSFVAAATMTAQRVYCEAITMANGKILIVGGYPSLSSAEVYDPTKGTFAVASAPNYAQLQFSLLALKNGTIFMSPGYLTTGSIANKTSVTEIFDPGTGLFFSTPAASVPSSTRGLSALLGDGSVLIVGLGLPARTANLYMPPSTDPTGANPF